MAKKHNVSLAGNRIVKPVVYKLVFRNNNPATQGRHYPMDMNVPSEDEIYDEDEGMRIIKYVAGERTIFEDSFQRENPRLKDIIFINGRLTVNPRDKMLIEYLDRCNFNRSNPNRIQGSTALFFKEDKVAETNKRLEFEDLQFDALTALNDMSAEDMASYARALGVSIDREFELVKWDMKAKAKADPQAFLDGIDNPRTKIKGIVLDAIEQRIIEVNSREINWINGKDKSLIIPVPVAQDAIEIFIDYAFEKDGEEVFELIKKRLK
jgi:hypothetical protein